METIFACLHSHFEFTQVVKDEGITEFIRFHEFILFPIDDGDVVPVLFETFGNVRADEAGAAPDADFGAIAGGEGEGFVLGSGGHDGRGGVIKNVDAAYQFNAMIIICRMDANNKRRVGVRWFVGKIVCYCVADLDIFGEANLSYGGIVQCHEEIVDGSRVCRNKDLFWPFLAFLFVTTTVRGRCQWSF